MNLLQNSDMPWIFTVCGRGAKSSFRTLCHGLDVEESISSEFLVFPMPFGQPSGMRTVSLCFIGVLKTSTDADLQTRLIPTLLSRSSMEILSFPFEKQLKKCRTPVSFHQHPLLLSSKLVLTPSCRCICMAFVIYLRTTASISGQFLKEGLLLPP